MDAAEHLVDWDIPRAEATSHRRLVASLTNTGEDMPRHMTRSKLIRMWFALVAFVVVAAVAFGAAVTVSTWAMLLTLALVPPVIVLLLWPGVQPLTASEVIHGADRRN